MKISSVERKILWAAIEDYAGLWELVWELASSCPEIPEPERKAVAERIVTELLEHGCIELYERHELGGREGLVPKGRWEELLSNELNWHEPAVGSTQVLVGATPFGEEVCAAEVGK